MQINHGTALYSPYDEKQVSWFGFNIPFQNSSEGSRKFGVLPEIWHVVYNVSTKGDTGYGNDAKSRILGKLEPAKYEQVARCT